VISSRAVPTPTLPPKRLLAAALIVLAAAAAQAAPQGAPAPADDAVMSLLAEHKALKDRPGLVQSVRDTASDLVMSAMNFLGVPYRRGGNTESTGFDCSGFTRHIFENSIGLVLPRRADEQASLASLLQIKRDELKPGDLVFFNTMRRTFSHVGIYIGDDKFIHSPRSGGAVRIEDMSDSYWARRFTGARRAEQAAPASPR
jgi:cell wall-associated NlpC family hydrolase